MSEVRYSIEAEADLVDIDDYTVQRWNEDQAVRYAERLEEACERLARMPNIGRRCDHLRPGLRRWEEGSHVIFYEQEPGGILVSRILHKLMSLDAHRV